MFDLNIYNITWMHEMWYIEFNNGRHGWFKDGTFRVCCGD